MIANSIKPNKPVMILGSSPESVGWKVVEFESEDGFWRNGRTKELVSFLKKGLEHWGSRPDENILPP